MIAEWAHPGLVGVVDTAVGIQHGTAGAFAAAQGLVHDLAHLWKRLEGCVEEAIGYSKLLLIVMVGRKHVPREADTILVLKVDELHLDLCLSLVASL